LKNSIDGKQKIIPVVTDYMKYVLTEEEKLKELQTKMEKATNETEQLRFKVQIAEYHDSKLTVKKLEELEKLQREMVNLKEKMGTTTITAKALEGAISVGAVLLAKLLFK